MTLHLGLPHHHQRTAEQQNEIREARRLLKEKIRDDWDYPALPEYQVAAEGMSSNGKAAGGFRFHLGNDEALRDLDFEALEWKERDYSSDESEEEGQPQVQKRTSKKSLEGNYKFEGPDSVGTELSNRKLARKRKRRQRLEEEMTWNAGLSHFMARRDAWCGAKTQEQVRTTQSRGADDIGTFASVSAGSTPRTSTSSTTAHSASTTATSPDPAIQIAGMTLVPPSDVLVPVAARILASHPIRRRLIPNMYPEIYTKIILQARTPSVPLNLKNIVEAMVRGWKDDGEWPPKQGPIEKSIGRKKGSTGGGLRDGVKAVGKILRITGGESAKEKT